MENNSAASAFLFTILIQRYALARASPRARQAATSSSPGASLAVTDSAVRFSPTEAQSLAQARIHSPPPLL